MQQAETILRELTSQFPENLEYGEAMLNALFRQDKTEDALSFFFAVGVEHARAAGANAINPAN